MSVSFQIRGTSRILKQLEKADQVTKDAIGAAIYEKGQQILDDALPLTPKDTGFLRSSRYATPSRATKAIKKIGTNVGYGADYATHVHEDTRRTFRVGRSKFLQIAVNRHRRGFVKAVGVLTRKFIRQKASIKTVPNRHPKRPKRGSGRKKRSA